MVKQQYTKEFKEDTVRYLKEHKELGIQCCVKNLGISGTALTNWKKISKEKEGSVSMNKKHS